MAETQAALLFSALMRKLAERTGSVGAESVLAEGLAKPKPGTKTPPRWALNAAKVVAAGWSKLLGPAKGGEAPSPRQVGVLLGQAAAWQSYLSVPSPTQNKIEAKSPALGKLRQVATLLAQPQLDVAEAFEARMAEANLNARDLRQLTVGQHAGAAAVVDEAGELHAETTVRSQVCLFVWLYWKDLSALRSLSDLQKFLEEFQVEGLTRKNLEKVCAEIGLRFKGRGRPKNPTKSGKRVGIKKSTTGVKRRDDHSRRRQKRQD